MATPVSFLGQLSRPFFLSPRQGARTSIHVAASTDLATTSGRYFVRSRPWPVSPAARDDRAAARLWSISEQLIAAPPV
jgi:hypothetical protein